VNHVPDSAVLQSAIDGTALVVFVLAVAVLSEYVFLNGHPLHRFVALAGAVPLVPLLPRYAGWMTTQPAVGTWLVALIVGFLAVNFCQQVFVVPLDRALEERRHQRRLRELLALRDLRLAAPVAVESDASAPDPDYFRMIDEFDAVFGRVVTAGDPLAKVRNRDRDVA
jgi:hypothetical protein